MKPEREPFPSSCPCGSDFQTSEAMTPIAGFGWRLGITLALAGQSMMIGLGYNNARHAGEAPDWNTPAYWGIHGVLMLCVFLSLILLGKPLAVSLWYALREGKITIESLFSLSLLGAFVASLIASISGRGDVYYEVVVIVLAIYSFGRQMGSRQRDQVFAATREFREAHAYAMVLGPDGQRNSVAVEKLRDEDIVEVRPGEFNAVDGCLIAGEGFWRETAMTGEPAPVRKSKGDRVSAGTFPLDAIFRIKPGPDQKSRMIDAILDGVEMAKGEPTRFQKQADQLVRWFVPAVILISVVTGLGWWLGGLRFDEALFRAMAVLLIACPCALGLATPIAVWGGLNRLAQWGIVAKSARLLDHLAEAEIIFLDKTGTLSLEDLRIDGFQISANLDIQEDELKAEVASLESQVDQPVAIALRSLSSSRLAVHDFKLLPGVGIEGRVGSHFLRLTTASSGREKGMRIQIERDGILVGHVQLCEQWRPGIFAVLEDLQSMGVDVRILTGDPRPPDLSYSMEAGLSPSDKMSRIRDAQTRGKRVLFVGDGLNDAGAISLSDGSLVWQHGPDLSTAAADGILLGQALQSLPRAIGFSRLVQQKLIGNLRWALVYNGIGITIAACGWLHPVFAAILMVGSSAVVSARILQSLQAD